MRQQNHHAAAVGDFNDGRCGALDAREVGHLAVLHRNVQVDADEDAFALEVGGVVEGAEAHGKL